MLYFDNSVKVNKRFTAAVMAAALLVSFSACNKTADNRETTFTAETKNTVNPDISEPNQSIGSGALITETTTEKAEETAVSSTEQDQTTASEETSASETSKKAAVKIGKTKVTDAAKKTYKTKFLGKVTNRIPKITIEGVDTKKINQEMYAKLKKNYSSGECGYQYYIGKTYVSILMDSSSDAEGDTYEAYIFNISRITGKKMSRKEMLKALGMKSSKFEARAKKGIKKYLKKTQVTQYIKTDKLMRAGYNKAISKKTLKNAMPYKNSKGKLCFFVKDMVQNGGRGHGPAFDTC